jgi:hypothetical protein
VRLQPRSSDNLAKAKCRLKSALQRTFRLAEPLLSAVINQINDRGIREFAMIDPHSVLLPQSSLGAYRPQSNLFACAFELKSIARTYSHLIA